MKTQTITTVSRFKDRQFDHVAIDNRSGLAGTATEACRVSEVEQAFSDLGNAQDTIEKLLTDLRNRLQPVLRTPNEEPLEKGPGVANHPYSAPLAHRIFNVTDNLRGNIRLVEDVLSRLEV